MSLNKENIEKEMDDLMTNLDKGIDFGNRIKFILQPMSLSVNLKVNTEFLKNPSEEFIKASVNIGSILSFFFFLW
jgi:hypothetical protein